MTRSHKIGNLVDYKESVGIDGSCCWSLELEVLYEILYLGGMMRLEVIYNQE